MAKVKIQGNASGTGVLTVTAPNTDTDRTITLPDADVTLGTDATKLPLAGGTMTGKIIVDQNSNDKGVHITTDATTDSAIQVEADSLTTGRAAIFYSHSGNTGTRDLVKIHNDNAASTGTTAFNVTQDSTGLAADFAGTGGIRSAGGIKFGTDTAAANTLDDYEEGDWTPNVGGNATYNSQAGKYIKVGNMVTAKCTLNINAINSSGKNIIYGLPFASTSGSATPSVVGYYVGLSVNPTWIGCYVDANNTTVTFIWNTGNSYSIGANGANLFQNSARIDICVNYQAA